MKFIVLPCISCSRCQVPAGKWEGLPGNRGQDCCTKDLKIVMKKTFTEICFTSREICLPCMAFCLKGKAMVMGPPVSESSNF